VRFPFSEGVSGKALQSSYKTTQSPLGFTNSLAIDCLNSVKPFAHPCLLVLEQIISQCGFDKAFFLI